MMDVVLIAVSTFMSPTGTTITQEATQYRECWSYPGTPMTGCVVNQGQYVPPRIVEGECAGDALIGEQALLRKDGKIIGACLYDGKEWLTMLKQEAPKP